MATKATRAALFTAAGVLGVAAVTTGTVALSPLSVTETTTVAVAPEIAENQYIGDCTTVTPPEPDPCEAAQNVIRYSFFGALVNASNFKTWKKGSPGDYGRLCSGPIQPDGSQTCVNGLMAYPQCSTPTNPQPQTMRTFFGAAIADAVEAYACARGTEAINFPAPNPPPTGTGDKTAPTAPGPLNVNP